ncbi:Hypp3503 [Branchiostoma lanceolatum]|uniref:Hypp3503 protein n=1 Tax=Branchiostoma lanceolatum TaxID=7740 RepID=A0A8K0A0F9_BRALA|nr:Hypp3503 [Branchiostoma lanceolatum]
MKLYDEYGAGYVVVSMQGKEANNAKVKGCLKLTNHSKEEGSLEIGTCAKEGELSPRLLNIVLPAVCEVRSRGSLLEKVEDSCSATWTDRSNKRAEEILDKAYMSSKSSGDEGQEGFKVRPLALESKSLGKLKDSLDKVSPLRDAARGPSDEGRQAGTRRRPRTGNQKGQDPAAGRQFNRLKNGADENMMDAEHSNAEPPERHDRRPLARWNGHMAQPLSAPVVVAVKVDPVVDSRLAAEEMAVGEVVAAVEVPEEEGGVHVEVARLATEE